MSNEHVNCLKCDKCGDIVREASKRDRHCYQCGERESLTAFSMSKGEIENYDWKRRRAFMGACLDKRGV